MDTTLTICLLWLAMAASSRVPAHVTKLVSQANDYFSDAMFHAVSQEVGGKSFVQSGYSLLVPLSQLQLAAGAGPTADQLARATRIAEDHLDAPLSSVYQDLLNVNGITVKAASRIYIADRYKLNEDFLAKSRKYFKTEDPVTINVQDPDGSARVINKWVEEQTNSRITNLVDPRTITPRTVDFLINAIYFKGKWAQPFGKYSTEPAEFHVTPQQTVLIPTMYVYADYLYSERSDLDATVLKMPFQGVEAYMTFILPNKMDGLTDLVAKFQGPQSMRTASSNVYSQRVKAYIPKFKIETTTDLKKILQKIGITRIFSETQAQMKYMVQNEEIYIEQAIQKVFVEIDEEGAEAAVANSFQGGKLVSMYRPPPPSKEFRADHPFLFYIEARDVMLFSGVFTGNPVPTQ